MVNANVPSAGLADRAAVDLAARILLSVGDAQARACGGQAPYDRTDVRDLDAGPHHAGTDACAIRGLPAPLDGVDEELTRIGSIDTDDAISRCAVVDRSDADTAKAFGPGLFSVTVIRNPEIVKALSPTGVRATVTAVRGTPLTPSDEDLRYDRDAVTEVVCEGSSRHVHVFATGSDADYAQAKRAALAAVAELLGCG
jgi:hypothetical protein